MNWIQASFLKDTESFLTSGVLKSATAGASRGVSMGLLWVNAAVAMALLFLPNWNLTTPTGIAIAAAAFVLWATMTYLMVQAVGVLVLATPLSRNPEDCKKALQLAADSPSAKKWRDHVVSEAREFVDADLAHMSYLALAEGIASGALVDFDTTNARKAQARVRNVTKLLILAALVVFPVSLQFLTELSLVVGLLTAGLLFLGASIADLNYCVETFSYSWAKRLTPLVRGPQADAELVALWEKHGFIRCSWGCAAEDRAVDSKGACRELHGFS